MSKSSVPVWPTQIVLNKSKDMLQIDWSDHISTSLTADWLRQKCRCADCLSHRSTPIENQSVLISQAEPVGQYALLITFSDGHARGIFPWAYLRQLAFDQAMQPL